METIKTIILTCLLFFIGTDAFSKEHRFSTSVKAQEIKFLFKDDVRLNNAVKWCKSNGIDKIYLETFRFGYLVEEPLLKKVKERFESAGIETAGLVTPTMIAKASTGWNTVCCYTDKETQKRVRKIFAFTARHFNTVLIDDFWFTDCQCEECKAARKAKTVTIEGKSFPVEGSGWGDYRRELMNRLAEKCVIPACKTANPNTRVILKFPCWYDSYQDKGYDPIRATRTFDAIWVGTETRDYSWKNKKGTPQPAAFFLMNWLLSIGKEKCEGAWFDPLWTTPETYVEQARFSILGGAKESLLHSYGYLTLTDKEGNELAKDDVVAKKKLKGVGGMGTPNGKKDFAAFMSKMTDLRKLAEETSKRTLTGIAAYKPANRGGDKDNGFFNMLGMTGVPLVAYSEFPEEAPSACFTGYVLADSKNAERINKYIDTGRPTLISGYLAKKWRDKLKVSAKNVLVLPTEENPWQLLDMDDDALDNLRNFSLKPFKVSCKGPNRINMVMYTDGSYVLSNFHDEAITVKVGDKEKSVAARGCISEWK